MKLLKTSVEALTKTAFFYEGDKNPQPLTFSHVLTDSDGEEYFYNLTDHLAYGNLVMVMGDRNYPGVKFSFVVTAIDIFGGYSIVKWLSKPKHSAFEFEMNQPPLVCNRQDLLKLMESGCLDNEDVDLVLAVGGASKSRSMMYGVSSLHNLENTLWVIKTDGSIYPLIVDNINHTMIINTNAPKSNPELDTLKQCGDFLDFVSACYDVSFIADVSGAV